MAHVKFFKIEVKFSSSDTISTKVTGNGNGAIKKRYVNLVLRLVGARRLTVKQKSYVKSWTERTLNKLFQATGYMQLV